MSATSEPKIRTTVAFTPKTEIAISTEARRLGISFADMVRRITDMWADEMRLKASRPPERIVVLDRETGALRHTR